MRFDNVEGVEIAKARLLRNNYYNIINEELYFISRIFGKSINSSTLPMLALQEVYGDYKLYSSYYIKLYDVNMKDVCIVLI